MSTELQVKVRPSITSNNLAEIVATEELKKTSNFETLKQSYLNLMQQLEIDGIPKEKVSTVGAKIVVDKKRNILKQKNVSLEEIKRINIGSWWYDIAREENYIDPNKSHSATDPEQKIVLPIETENEQYIKVLKNTKDFLDVAINKLKHHPFMSLLDEDSKIILSLHDWQAHLDTANSYFDHKEKIPPNTQHILLHFIGTMSSNNDVAIEYFKQRAKSQHLTGKQISKYRSGEIRTKLEIFNPKNRVTAILWNYFGVPCNKCKSWKVLHISTRSEFTKVKCLECENIFQVDSTSRCNYCAFPFFIDEIDFIKKGNKCPNCKEVLPDYLINSL